MTGKERDSSYVLVGNIPANFHSVDLRAFFSQFTETGKFQCFHFRHRPEILKKKEEQNGTVEESLTMKGKTTCCVVRLKQEHVKDLFEAYYGENWTDRNGKLCPLKVVIFRISVKDSGSLQHDTYQTRREKRDHKRQCVEFVKEDLLKLSEFHPPSFMPNGNVGTSLNVFLDLIRTCQLPPHIIKKLGLSFPIGRSKHRYGNVPFSYGTDNEGNVSLCADITYGSNKTKPNEILPRPEKEDHMYGPSQGRNKDYSDCNLETNSNPQDVKLSKEFDSDCADEAEDSDSEPEEDWERHEALHDDVDCQARTKERLYENKIELKWEKGGSGLVFYTDAAYWDSLNGDFDEQTADDWNIDMGLYEKGGTSDRHSRALLEMRIEEQRRAGINVADDDTSVRKIGDFEKHTKGFGGRLMKKQGWEEGASLGTSQPGIKEPIANEGQNPHCKRGLGFYGEKIERHVKKRRVDRDIVISTVYDAPEEKVSTPFQSAGPFTLKYRNKVEFVAPKTKSP